MDASSAVLSRFCLEGFPVSCVTYGEGHINCTYLVTTDAGRRYILQQLNHVVFKDIPGLMENVAAVTAHLASKNSDPRTSLCLVPTVDGSSYLQDADGEYWRIYNYVEGSICLQKAETPEDFYQSARAFGCFQQQLSDFPAASLHETIPHFHNTPDRYRKFRLAIQSDCCGRLQEVEREVDFLMQREEKAGTLQHMRDTGSLPLCVTHNDTKLNNVLFDALTRQPLCIVDLDTVMPGLVAYDFGDSIRFGASTGAEDEKDLSRIQLSLPLYETYVRGFVPAVGNLCPEEIQSLPLGAWTLTLENAVRFLTDYLEGDPYYHIARPEHNLDRCRTHIKLAADMERKRDAMLRIAEAAV